MPRGPWHKTPGSNMPLVSEKHRCGSNHDPREHPNGKQNPRQYMKSHQHRVEIRTNPIAEEGKRCKQVEGRASPTEQKSHFPGGKKRSKHRKRTVLWQPHGQRLGVQQPIRIEFGQSCIEIHHSQQKANRSHCKRGDVRRFCRCGEPTQHEGHK